MLTFLAVLATAILALMALKLARAVRERRAARAGFITFGGDDRYQARNVRRDVHDSVMIARVQLEMGAQEFEQVIARIEQNYLRWFERINAAIEHKPGGQDFAAPLEIHPTRQPFVLADVRPLEEATLVPIAASNTAHVAQRLLHGREVTVVPVALTGNLPPELQRVGLIGVPASWYHAHRRSDDDRPALLTAIDLMTDFTESITQAALR